MVKKTSTLKVVGQTTLTGDTEFDFAQHKVVEGDTIYSVWLDNKDKTTVGAIKTANGLNTNELRAGRTIKIPLVL